MKIGIITGASSGMGEEFARQLDTEALDEMWVIARRKERLQSLADHLHTRVRIITADLTDKEALQGLQEMLEQQNPSVHFLVNAAGFGKFGDYHEISLENQMAMIDLNVKALVAVTQMVLPFMQRGSHIIQLASSSAFFPLPYLNVYASTKAFVQHYSYGLREELAPRGIYVTQVSPGWVQTEFFDNSQNDTSRHAPKRYTPMYTAQRVVKKALQDAQKRKAVSVCGAFVKLHRFCGRFAPRWFMKAQWRSRLR